MSDNINKGGISSRAHWIGFALAAAVVFNSAPITSAAIILQQSPPVPLPLGNLVQYTITAVGTAGERIRAFDKPAIRPMDGSLGIHNVAQAVTNSGTPTKDQHIVPLFDSSWAPYDTHFLFNNANLALPFPPDETNDGATTGTLGLSSAFGTPRSGFGTMSTSANPNTMLTLPNMQVSSQVAFMQVVMRRGDFALFDVEIVAEGGTSRAVIRDYLIGIPEPSSIALLVVPLLGLVTKRRLRNHL